MAKSIFIGFEDPKSITTGQGNENSFKSIKIKISNIDTSYSYVYAYYSRYTAVDQEEFNTEYIKIDKKFMILLVILIIIHCIVWVFLYFQVALFFVKIF